MLMDLQTCLKKMELVGVLAFATVDAEGAPQISRYQRDSLRAGRPVFLHSPGQELLPGASGGRPGCRFCVIRSIKR